jgi:3-hydroxyacyl-CoA dehydrogenase/enoyl-CoA hydratase/3-hydroxybutyryl-CoA epimerase/enoyl-CoA isomerase
MVFMGSKAFVAGQAGPGYPAPVAAIEAIEKGAHLSRDEALSIEGVGFAKMAKTPAAKNLVGLFLGDQFLKKKAKGFTKAQVRKVERSGVLGAGIMGGGVAYQSASRGIPIVMKDIRSEALDLGMKEAGNLFSKLVERKRLSLSEMTSGLAKIRATLSLDELKDLDLVVEAVVENESVKKSVLKETESILPEDAILTSNTSSISITRLAKELKRPENFCGMHFFNPVHRMPLVETIRGEKTGEAAVASTVAYALALGKTPIVVNDCPGFLVNRVLFAYLGGFIKLLQQGVSFTRIDKIMEKFGWPMGPAYLLDVVGIDTSFHASAVMREGFPERMTFGENTAIQVLFEAKRFGQKNGQGFYQYTVDKKGRPQKMIDPNVDALLAQGVVERIEVSDDEIVERMMLPMLMESSRCLQEKIVDTPTEVDLGLVYGLGFPPYRGGIFAWADQVGISNIVQWSEKYLSLGAAYLPSEQLINMKASQTKFYPLK